MGRGFRQTRQFDDHLEASGTLTSAQVSDSDHTEITKAYTDKSEPKEIQSTGLHIASVRYVVIKADERSIYGMKVRV